MSDAEKLFLMEKQCFPGDFWSKSSLLSLLESPYSLCICADDGYVFGSVCGDEAELYRIAVIPAFRRCGKGGALLCGFIELCRKRALTAVFLEVRSRNFPAIALYENAGFERIALRRNYYKDDDAAIYRLGLK